MDFDFSEEFGPASETPLQKLRQQWSNRRPSRLHGSPASPRPQELFPSPRQGQSSSPSPGSPSSALATPNEDAFVSTKASLRRREYEKLEMWISSGGAVEDFAPWFREMLADQDDDCLVSALRAVAAHYRRAAQQQALGEEDSGVPVPLCWLAPLAERLMSCASGLVAHEASELVAACLACTERSSAPHQATFFQRFATLSRGKVHLLAACQAVLQPEDWQEMLRLVRQSAREELPKDTWRRLPEELKNLAKELEPTAASPLPVRPTEDSAGAEAWSDTPKTWRQRVRCLEHLAERGDVRNLWPQLVLQVEDDHPAVSAAALHCLACRAPQMTPPAEHLLCRLAQALRQRLREPRCRMRRAALEFLRSMQGAAQCLLLAQTFGVSKERARKAALGMKRDDVSDDPLETLMIEAFGATKCQGAPGTPSPDRTRRFWSASPQKATPPSTAATTPGTTGRMKLTNLTPETEETPSPKALEPELRGSGALPSESTLLSFEATPQRQVPELQALQEESDLLASPCSTVKAATGRSDDDEGEAPQLEAMRSASPLLCKEAQMEDSDHAELTWSFQKIHMITLELSRAGSDEVALWRRLGQLFSREAFQGPLQRFLLRWMQRQRRRAAVKENLAPGKTSKSLRMDDYASLRELCSDEDLPGAFPHSVLSQLRKTLLSTARPTAAVLQATVEALEKCVTACGPAFRPWQRFAGPLLRLAAQQHGLRRSVAAVLLSSGEALRRTWRRWMQVCESSGTTDQALVAESLQLLAACRVREMPSEVLHDILRVACSYLEASRLCVSSRAVTLAAQRCLQMLGTRLGREQLMKEVSSVAPGLNLDALLTGPAAKPLVQVAVRGRATRSSLSAEVKEVELDSGILATAKPTPKERIDQQAQLQDVRTLRSPSSMPSPDLRKHFEDLSAREVPSQVRLVLHALSDVLRLCTEASGDEATDVLQAAHEEMLAMKGLSEEVLRQLEPVPLFRCLLQLLLQLESLSQGDLRRWATPILLEVAPFLARAMEAIEMGKQLLAWLELAKVVCGGELHSQSHRSPTSLSAAKKTWALRFCARAAERCGSALAEGDTQLAWEALAKLAQISEKDPGNAETGVLEALCAKIVELYPSQAEDFAKLTAGASTESWFLKLIQQELGA